MPNNHVISDSGNHLYKIGLTVHGLRVCEQETKRHLYLRYFILLIICVIIMHNIISISLPLNANERMFIYNGEWTYYYPEIIFHYNITELFLCIATIISTILHHISDEKGVV